MNVAILHVPVSLLICSHDIDKQAAQNKCNHCVFFSFFSTSLATFAATFGRVNARRAVAIAVHNVPEGLCERVLNFQYGLEEMNIFCCRLVHYCENTFTYEEKEKKQMCSTSVYIY